MALNPRRRVAHEEGLGRPVLYCCPEATGDVKPPATALKPGNLDAQPPGRVLTIPVPEAASGYRSRRVIPLDHRDRSATQMISAGQASPNCNWSWDDASVPPGTRTLADLIEIDFAMLVITGSASRQLMTAERVKWHRALRARAREAGRGLECGHVGRVAWAQLGYRIGERHPAGVAYRDYPVRSTRA